MPIGTLTIAVASGASPSDGNPRANTPLETLRAIAALVKSLPGGRRGRVTAHTYGFFETVAAVPGARLVHCPPTDAHPRRVYGAEVELDGVTFEGLYTAREPR